MPVAVVTGASRGFGEAVAGDLLHDGWSVVIDARGRAGLDEAAERLRQASPGARLIAIAGDIADAGHREQLVAAAARLGGIDLLVNNASSLGPSPQPPLGRYPLDVLEAVYMVNVIAPLALVQTALSALRESTGTVVNVTSDAGSEAYAGWGGYGSSKAALDQWSNVLAVEEPGIRVYSFDPGDMRTQMHQEAFPGEDISDRPLPATVVPALKRLLAERPPSGRYRAAELTDVGR